MQSLLTPQLVAWLKLAIAAATALLLYVEALRPSFASNRVKRALAIVLAVAAVGCYVDFFQYRTRHAYHRWEMFHYVLGAKYTRELGYERLYACTALADAQTGNEAAVRARPMRSLVDDTLVPAALALEHPEQCTDRFTAARWREFRHDVVWFRRAAGSGAWWDAMQRDHGFNASPVWTVSGHWLASLAPVSHALCTWLSALDVMLLVSGIAVLAWGFGWRIALVAIVFWGTQAPAAYDWTGGSLLRQDWMFLLLASAALMRRGRYGLAGAALGYASLLRIFPVLFWSGPLVLAVAHVVRHRRVPGRLSRMLAGGAIAAALLLPAGAAVAGTHSYQEFWRHITMHAATPISNHMSLRTLFSVDPAAGMAERARGSTDRPPAVSEGPLRWDEARLERYRKLEPLYFGTGALLLGWFAYVVAKLRTPYLALALSVVPVVVLTDPSCYYYSFWVVTGVLARARRSTEMVLLGLAAVGQSVLLAVPWMDLRYVALAALYVACALLFLVAFGRPPTRTTTPRGATSRAR